MPHAPSPEGASPERSTMFKSPRKAAGGAFLPEDFVVPTLVAGPDFQIRPITVHDVVKDYGAVLGSLDRLGCRFGPEWGGPTASSPSSRR